MRYVIVDSEGASREHFDSYADVIGAIAEMRADDPELVAELCVLIYNDEGERVGEPIEATQVPYIVEAERNVTDLSPSPQPVVTCG